MAERCLPDRTVEATPIFGEDGSCRGWVRFDVDRATARQGTEFCITIDTSSFLSPFEARAFARSLVDLADMADRLLGEAAQGRTQERQ